ncbi:MAG: segregation and condensation protein A [Chloroflexota bacterium]
MVFRISDQDTYHVRLSLFEGPLDLLLHLIEREELDITKISLAQVTDQYLAHISQVKEVQADQLADFLVVAAKLLLIKSQMLLPRPDAAPASLEEEDPGEVLARQLREYKRFKEAARHLKERQDSGARTYLRLAPTPRLNRQLDLSHVRPEDLQAAMCQVLLNPLQQETPAIAPISPGITIADQIALLKQRLGHTDRITFSSLLTRARSRLEIVVTFLAILEMFKARQILLRQDDLFGEIHIEAIPAVETL